MPDQNQNPTNSAQAIGLAWATLQNYTQSVYELVPHMDEEGGKDGNEADSTLEEATMQLSLLVLSQTAASSALIALAEQGERIATALERIARTGAEHP